MAMNEQDQVIHSISDKQFEILVFNNTEDTITLSNNILIGSLSPAEKVRALRTQKTPTLKQKTISSKDSHMSNTPSKKLKPPMWQKRRSHIKNIINPDDNQVFNSHPKILDKLLDLLMENWDIFYREGNSGGTNLIEHPVYTPKGAIPIKIKNRPDKSRSHP